mgnify:CR=1 FL=1
MRSIAIILPSEASMDKNEEFGLLPRWRRLMDEYKKYFDEINVYTCDKQNFSEKLGVRHHPCKWLINVKYLKAISYNFWLLKEIGNIKADIIRFFGSVYPLMPLFCMRNKTPKITSYQYDFYMKTKLDFGNFRGKIGYWAEKYSVKYVGNIITTTYELKDIIKKRYGVDSIVNPNFVDLSLFHPSDVEDDYLFFAGRIFYTKGIDLMIEMMCQFKKEGRTTKFILAGDGDIEHYRKIIKDKDVSELMQFVGPKSANEIADYMRHAKVFVFPTTTQEGHPKSLIEALASGCPCVVSKVLGNTEVVQEKFHNGIFVEPCSQEQLNNAVRQLLDDRKLRSILKINAVKSAQKFDVIQVVKREVDIIDAIIVKNKNGI